MIGVPFAYIWVLAVIYFKDFNALLKSSILLSELFYFHFLLGGSRGQLLILLFSAAGLEISAVGLEISAVALEISAADLALLAADPANSVVAAGWL